MSDVNVNPPAGAPIVLVGGAWLGAWAWRDVLRDLRGRGHDVYAATLTGLGDRVHVARPDVDLDTHITDVVKLLEFEELTGVILVGHSYAGLVVTGAADRSLDRIAHIVYVDTGPVPSGTSMMDFEGEHGAELEGQVAEHGDGWLLPAPTIEEHAKLASVRGIDEQAAARYEAHKTPQPFGTYRQPLELSSDAVFGLPRTAILCDDGKQIYAMAKDLNERGQLPPPLSQMVGDGWNFAELDTGHWPMFSAPAELAAVLRDVAVTVAG